MQAQKKGTFNGKIIQELQFDPVMQIYIKNSVDPKLFYFLLILHREATMFCYLFCVNLSEKSSHIVILHVKQL